MTTATIERSSGPNLLVRFIWWLFIGWWASGIALRPRVRTWTVGQDADWRTVNSDRGRGQVGGRRWRL